MRTCEAVIVRRSRGLSVLALAAALALPLTGFSQPKAADHSAHQPATAPAEMSMADQVTELRTKVSNLEMALQHKQMGMDADTAKPAMGAMPSGAGGSMPGKSKSKMDAMGAGKPGMGQMGSMPSGGGGAADSPAPAANGAAPTMGGMMQEMGAMMQQMGGMMNMEMGGMGSMPSGGMPAGGSPAGGMPGMAPAQPMQKMQPGMSGMMGMETPMGMPPAPAMAASALPGFPGASHLYHIGADDFFLNHDQHITLTTEQRTSLEKAKEQTLLEKATAERKTAQAEQELWTLTASDQPDAANIESKIHEIEKLRGDQRLSFIRAVGEAAKVLTDEQRKSLLGQLPPQNPSSQPAPAGTMAPMKDM